MLARLDDRSQVGDPLADRLEPAVLQVPEGVDVRKVDLALERQILSFHEHRKSGISVVDRDEVTA